MHGEPHRCAAIAQAEIKRRWIYPMYGNSWAKTRGQNVRELIIERAKNQD